MIKKLSILTALAVFTILPTFAQESGLGGKLGLNLANVAGDVVGTSNRTSLHLGGYYNHMITDQLALQPEFILWSGQGYKFSTRDSSGAATDAVVKLNYLNIPIIGKYYFTEAIAAHAGLQFGINLAANAEVGGTSSKVEDVSVLDLAFAIGAGYELESGLNFSFRYNIGLSNVNSGSGGSYTNNVFQISVGYLFTEELF